MFVLFIYHFWTRNRQILNFEHFELVLACFYSVKRAFSTKWWPGEENAPKIIFFAFLVSFHINTTYIKLDWNSDNFLIFWCTLLTTSILPSFSTSQCATLSSPYLCSSDSRGESARCARTEDPLPRRPVPQITPLSNKKLAG